MNVSPVLLLLAIISNDLIAQICCTSKFSLIPSRFRKRKAPQTTVSIDWKGIPEYLLTNVHGLIESSNSDKLAQLVEMELQESVAVPEGANDCVSIPEYYFSNPVEFSSLGCITRTVLPMLYDGLTGNSNGKVLDTIGDYEKNRVFPSSQKTPVCTTDQALELALIFILDSPNPKYNEWHSVVFNSEYVSPVVRAIKAKVTPIAEILSFDLVRDVSESFDRWLKNDFLGTVKFFNDILHKDAEAEKIILLRFWGAVTNILVISWRFRHPTNSLIPSDHLLENSVVAQLQWWMLQTTQFQEVYSVLDPGAADFVSKRSLRAVEIWNLLKLELENGHERLLSARRAPELLKVFSQHKRVVRKGFSVQKNLEYLMRNCSRGVYSYTLYVTEDGELIRKNAIGICQYLLLRCLRDVSITLSHFSYFSSEKDDAYINFVKFSKLILSRRSSSLFKSPSFHGKKKNPLHYAALEVLDLTKRYKALPEIQDTMNAACRDYDAEKYDKVVQPSTKPK